MTEANENLQKPHRRKQSGGKIAKKKKAEAQASIADQRAKAQRNPKAFTCQSGRRAEKTAQRNMDLQEKRLHVPMVDRSSTDPPPMVVAVVGPPNVGKSTLIRCLVKRFTKHNIGEIKGPVTVVAGKKRRITFMECANDINAMIDVAKIADLILLMIDGSFGFEMETFEFLNILQSHGFPKIIGVLTHLDGFKDNKRLKKTKKKLKQRFWTEIYDGAKLFYLSGMINGKYLKNEIMNLSRFISIMKFRPLVWRNQHPYALVDRVEDITDPEAIRTNPKTNRTVSLYGYVRGTQFKMGQKLHIPGVGDQVIKDISLLEDPCPLPKTFNDPMKKSRRSLNEKERLLHAPMTDVSGILYDKDAVYINIPDNIYRDPASVKDTEQDEGETMLDSLQNVSNALDETMDNAGVQIFQNSAFIKNHEVVSDEKGMSRRKVIFGDESENEEEDEDDNEEDQDDNEEDQYDNEDDEEDNESEEENDSGDYDDNYSRRAVRDKYSLENSDPDEDGEDDIAFAETASEISEDDTDRWKKNLEMNLKANLKSKRVNLMKQIYDLEESLESSDHSDSEDDSAVKDEKTNDPDSLFFKVKEKLDQREKHSKTKDSIDSSLFHFSSDRLEKYEDESVLDSLRHRFITGDLKGATESNKADNDDEVFGDFEDLETGEIHGDDSNGSPEMTEEERKEEDLKRKKELLKLKFDAEYDGRLEDDDGPDNDQGGPENGETFYDVIKKDMQKQKDLNQQVLSGLDQSTRLQMEGYASGSYVKIILEDVPCEMIENFSPYYPIILGGLLGSEEQYGFVQVRIKRHRWFRKVLKSNDPLIVSLGWRRFQTLPVYSLCTDGTRNRMLKYTPEHMHCNATFYGPVTPLNTGFCAFQSVSHESSNFRVCATGVVCDLSNSPEIVKKLKLTGVPFKVMKKTAFIKDMFSSPLEVAKFEGASIRTVSGLRGQIKKAVRLPEGAFRATFEDKILISDIVFLRTWYPVTPKTYYNPVTSLLDADKKGWSGMRLVRDLRKDLSLSIPSNPDSQYKTIERLKRRFNPLRIPKTLQSQLPFASKPKLLKAQRIKSKESGGYLVKRTQLQEPEDKKAARLLVHLTMIQREREKKRKEKSRVDREKYIKRRAEEQEISERREREKKRRIMKEVGLKRAGSSNRDD